jgi:hypothetical protein
LRSIRRKLKPVRERGEKQNEGGEKTTIRSSGEAEREGPWVTGAGGRLVLLGNWRKKVKKINNADTETRLFEDHVDVFFNL